MYGKKSRRGGGRRGGRRHGGRSYGRHRRHGRTKSNRYVYIARGGIRL